MSNLYTRQVPRIGDKALLATFMRLADQLGVDGFSYQTVTNSVRKILVSEFPSEPSVKEISRADGQVVVWAQVVVGQKITITLSRNRDPQSAYWETLRVDAGNQLNDWPPEERLKAELAIADAFKFEGNLDEAAKGGWATFEVLFQQYEASLSHLRAMAAEQLEGLAERRASLDGDIQKERERLQGEFDRKEKELSGAIETRERALQDRLKDADESDAKTARRAIRNAMLSDVQARLSAFDVSPQTLRKRQPVRAGFYFLVVVFLFALGSIWADIHRATPSSLGADFARAITNQPSVAGSAPSSTPTVAAQVTGAVQTGVNESFTSTIGGWIRFALAFLGMAATVLYYIRWEMRWADYNAANEFQLRQFQIDVNRANWVIESALEWKKETQEVPPPELLAQLTKNLFSNQADAAADRVLHPADELASALLGSSSKLRLNLGGNEMEIEKPGKIPKEVKV